MKNIENFLALVVKTIQSDYESKKEATAAMENLLEETDKLSLEISGKRIVARGTMTLTESIAGKNKLTKLKPL
jgi:hypothetical protein